ncbi:hypothetical protein WR25_11234 [Diploscapter pachys]|uniref:Uncharacterized protein n=1 Tax=Diploscapter pachys TaxID=2018661 RepID=A0A2A2KCV8_9BILA|nr:hypothetical protein WR25_11234 [Diploscapter pachys]
MLQRCPIGRADHVGERLEPRRVFGDEGMVENRGGVDPLALVVRLDDVFADADQSGDVAAGLHLVILRGDRRRLARRHLDRVLRVGEAFEAAFLQRVEHHDLDAPLGATAQGVEKAG